MSVCDDSVILSSLGAPEIQLPLQEGNETEEVVVAKNETAVLSCPYIAQPDGTVTWMFRAVGEDDFENVTGDGIRLVNAQLLQ